MASNLFKNLSNMFTGGNKTNAFSTASHPTFKLQSCEPTVNKKTSFLDGLKKISGLEIENKTFEKLKTISKISDSGKTGTIIGDGVNWVFDRMRWPLPDQVGSVVKNFNPQVVNSAIGASRQIAQKVKQRNFKFGDIPEVLQDMGNFEALLGGIFVPDNVDQREFTKCEAIDYAMDFAKDYGMKYKFLFVVEFVPNDAYYAAINGGINPAAFVKDFTIPTISIEHEEVNMYNVRTKVPKFVNFSNANMVFYDDGRNHVMTMISNYLKTISPAFKSDDPLFIEKNSRNFGDIRNSSSLRVLDDSSTYDGITPTNQSTKNIFKEIRVYHVFFSGHYFNMYSFMNPRFNNISIEQLRMEANEVSAISVEFNYDTMYMETNRPFYSDKHSGGLMASSNLVNGIKFKGEGPSGTMVNNNQIGSRDPVDGSVIGGLVGEAYAINGAISNLQASSQAYHEASLQTLNDSETLASAANTALQDGDMESYKKYTKMSENKIQETESLNANSINSKQAAEAVSASAKKP